MKNDRLYRQKNKRRGSSVIICLITTISLLLFTATSFAKPGLSDAPVLEKAGKVSLRDALLLAEEAVKDRNYNEAISVLQTALQSNTQHQKSARNLAITDPGLAAKAWYRLAWISRALGEHYSAIDQFKQAADIIRGNNADRDFFATMLNDLGATYIIVSDYDSAIGTLTEASQSVTGSAEKSLAVKIDINLAHALLEKGVQESLEQRLDAISADLNDFTNKKEKAELLLSVGYLYHAAQKKFHLPANWRTRAYQTLSISLETATSMQNAYIASYANGFIGQLYEDEARFDEAMEYARKAIFYAQSVTANESLFKWEWLESRLLAAQGETQQALDAYRQTTGTLKKVRLNILLGAKSNFQRYIAPIYYEYVDLLLKSATSEEDAAKRLALRQEAISVLEKYKIAEVEDYFQSPCVESETSDTPVHAVDPRTAVIYPIVLDDRIELIVSVNNVLAQYTIPAERNRVLRVVRDFREKIEQPGLKSDFKQDAKTLYQWLVEPYLSLAKEAGVENLLFIPDGPLRSIPMSALYDGKKYLIQTFSTASTPSLSLTTVHKPENVSKKILLNGVTQAVQGYTALPSVDLELQSIGMLYPSVMLKDKAFTLARAEKELSQGGYSIVHIATHGEFSSDYRNSYLLTYDNKLTMAELQETIGLRKYKQDPLDLLVLSACQTAVGDDRAALGLAGVAIKAGARSAIATLWSISDKATSQLVAEFYKQLQLEPVTKAVALKNAQLTLINTQKYKHPYYWAPFLLIGNWL